MKVYHIPSKPACPLRVQMSDDEAVAALQFRDGEDLPFYWLLVSPEAARLLIAEHGMRISYTLPDTPDAQMGL